MTIWHTARLALFAWIIVLSLVVLGISAHFESLLGPNASATSVGSDFGLAIATSVLTLIAIAGVFVTDLFRRGAFTSLVWFELAWVGVLWVLWLATAGSIASLGTIGSCTSSYYDYYTASYYSVGDQGLCSEFKVAQAFTWLLWLSVFAWFWILLVTSIIAHTSRGHPGVWMGPVSDHPFFTGAKGNNTQMTTAPGAEANIYPPTHGGAPSSTGYSTGGHPTAQYPQV